MNLVRIGLFAVLMGLIFAGAVAAGSAVDPDVGPTAEEGHAAKPHDSREDDMDRHSTHGKTIEAPRGLALAGDGLRLVVDDTRLAAGRTQALELRILDGRDREVSDFDVEHERAMHVILVRRDLTGYQHVHPRLTDEGAWRVDVRLDEPGDYRLFADFVRNGDPTTLGVDLTVPGSFSPRALPRPAETAATGDGYEARLAEDGDDLRFTVFEDGRRVEDLEPYLGARGHLVALREGDLAYLHVHPQSQASEGREIRFGVNYPSDGRYRLFLQFKHRGAVHTTAFTREVDGEPHG